MVSAAIVSLGGSPRAGEVDLDLCDKEREELVAARTHNEECVRA
jgi:hypothetical protein